jgi:hypothetical protein
MISKKRGKRTYSKNIKRKYSKKRGKRTYSKNIKRKYSKNRKLIKGGFGWGNMVPQVPTQAQLMSAAAQEQQKLNDGSLELEQLIQNTKSALQLSQMWRDGGGTALVELANRVMPLVINRAWKDLWPLNKIIDLQLNLLAQDNIVNLPQLEPLNTVLNLQVKILAPDNIVNLPKLQPLYTVLTLQVQQLQNPANIVNLSQLEPLNTVLNLQVQQLKISDNGLISNPRSIEPLNTVLNLQIATLHTGIGLEQLEPLNSVLNLQFIKFILPLYNSIDVALGDVQRMVAEVWPEIFPLGIIYTVSSGQERTNYLYFVEQKKKDYHSIVLGIQSLSKKNEEEETNDYLSSVSTPDQEFLEYWLNDAHLINHDDNLVKLVPSMDQIRNTQLAKFYGVLNQQFVTLAGTPQTEGEAGPLLNYILDQSPILYNYYALLHPGVAAKLYSILVNDATLTTYLLTLAQSYSSAPPGRTPTPQEPLYSVIKAQLKILNVDPSYELLNQLVHLKRVLEIQTQLMNQGAPLETLSPLNYMAETFDHATLASMWTQPIPKNGGGGRVNKNIKSKKKIDLFKEIKKNKNKYLIGGRKTLKQDFLTESACKGEVPAHCDDSKYLKILSGMSLTSTHKIINHLLMRLHSTSLNDDQISSLMPYIEIILDGIHDFKQYFTKADFLKYCGAISNEQFVNTSCMGWLSEIYDSFAEDNLFVPLVKTNSAELIKNGEIWVHDENGDTAHQTELLNLYISRDIWGGTKHDAGRGLSHIKSLALSKSSGCPIDDYTHPNLVLKSLSTLIDPSPPTSLNLDATFKIASRNYINDIYDGYFEFFNDKLAPFKIRFKEYLDTSPDKCNRVRFAIYLDQETAVEVDWENAKNDSGMGGNMTYNIKQQIWQINTSAANVAVKNYLAFQHHIFLCNSGTYSTFTINNIQYSLTRFVDVISDEQFKQAVKMGWVAVLQTPIIQWIDAFFKRGADYKNVTHDPILFTFFCIMYLKSTPSRDLSLFIRLGLTFKLVGDRGQAWWVWKYNQIHPDRKIILATGDRMLMIFAISIGIPAVWSAQGKEYGLNYYYFPNTDSFDVLMEMPTLSADLIECLSNYKTISTYDNLLLDTLLKSIVSVRILTQKEAVEILYNSCWRFVETTLPIDIINESRSMTQQPYDIFLAFLKYTLKMDPFVGRYNENKIINGLVQKTVGKYGYKETNKEKSADDFYTHIAAGRILTSDLTIEQFLDEFITKFLPFQWVMRGANARWELGSLFKIKSAKPLMQRVLEWDGTPYESNVVFPYKEKLLNNIKNIVLSNIKELYIKHINNNIDAKLKAFIQGQHTITTENPSTINIQNIDTLFKLKLTKLNTMDELPADEATAAYTKLTNDKIYLRKTIKKALIIWASQTVFDA